MLNKHVSKNVLKWKWECFWDLCVLLQKCPHILPPPSHYTYLLYFLQKNMILASLQMYCSICEKDWILSLINMYNVCALADVREKKEIYRWKLAVKSTKFLQCKIGSSHLLSSIRSTLFLGVRPKFVLRANVSIVTIHFWVSFTQFEQKNYSLLDAVITI